MAEKLSTDHCLSQFSYLGLQIRHKCPPYPLINDTQSKSTLAFKPKDHLLSQDDFQQLIQDCLEDLTCQHFLTHLYNHYKSFGLENSEYICSFYNIDRDELDNWFEIMLMAGLMKKQEAYIEEKTGIHG